MSKPERPFRHRVGHRIGRNDRSLLLARRVGKRKACQGRKYLLLLGHNQNLLFSRDEKGFFQHAT